MATLQELIAQKADLEKRIAEAKSSTRVEALEKIRALMEENGLTLADLKAPSGPSRAKRATAPGKKVAAKYRNQETGETWSGRGLQPKWLKAAVAQGRKAEEFAV